MKGNEGDTVPWSESEENVREEVLRRNAKAGYCTKYGEPTGHSKIVIQAPTDRYRENYKRIFGHD